MSVSLSYTHNTNMENESFNTNTKTAEGETVVKTSTTSFVEDGAIVSGVNSAAQMSGGMTVQNQALKDFFAKPLLINQATWTTASAANTDLYFASVANTLTGNLNWMNKVQGFNNVRGSAVLRVMINANPFQAGKLLLHFVPCAASMDASYLPMVNAGLITKSQHPHVELDCRDGVAELEVPYITPFYYYDIKAGLHDWGTFYVTVLSPLVTGASGETTIDVSYYMYFKDFEMSAPMIPQSNKWSRKGAEVEAAYAADRPVSSTLSIVAKAASSLSAIPMITGVTEPVSWMLRGMSGVASYFGWSKPQNESNPAIMTNQYNRYVAGSEGADSAYPTALIATNRIKPLDNLSPYTGDEMSFQFLKRVVSYVDTYSWTTGNVSGTSLISIQVSPSVFFRQFARTVGAHTTQYLLGPPFAFVSNHFISWRGTIRVILKIVKTDFHTGRLQITWTPSQTTPYTVPTPSTGLLALREIVDIRTSSEICLDLPYLIPKDYLSYGAPSGNLDVVVLNELRAPETCSGTIQVMLFACAGENFEVQGPTNFSPVYSPQSGSWSGTQGAEVAVCDTIGDEQALPLDLSHSSLSFGEMFTSVKQLLNRYGLLSTSSAPAGGTPNLTVYPWSIGISYTLAGGVTTTGFVGDSLSYYAPCFLFRRGSMRLGVQLINTGALSRTVEASMTNSTTYATGTAGIVSSVPFSTTTTNDTYLTTYPNRIGSGGMILNDGTINSDYYHVPYYCNTRATLNIKNSANNNCLINDNSPRNTLIVSSAYNNVSGAIITRSCGDDFQLSYFVAAPPLFVSST